jgi:phytoene synthase
MDLDPSQTDTIGVQTFATFDDLYRYCYLVASVVGLVCIRVFGYTEPRAEKLAEQTGVAFQLTNILRDVKEDEERGRIYLPLDMLGQFNVPLERVRELASNAQMTENERRLLREVGQRAERYYRSADELLPLIDADSRAALWVLVTIYHDLLKKIQGSGYEVFGERISVPTPQKLWILTQGAAMSLTNRMLA